MRRKLTLSALISVVLSFCLHVDAGSVELSNTTKGKRNEQRALDQCSDASERQIVHRSIVRSSKFEVRSSNIVVRLLSSLSSLFLCRCCLLWHCLLFECLSLLLDEVCSDVVDVGCWCGGCWLVGCCGCGCWLLLLLKQARRWDGVARRIQQSELSAAVLDGDDGGGGETTRVVLVGCDRSSQSCGSRLLQKWSLL